MTIKIGRFDFEGPYTNTDYVKNEEGVYTILCKSNGNYNPIDVGETETLKERVDGHERRPCWNNNCHSALTVAVLYTSGMTDDQRRAIEKEIRDSYNFPCGVF